MLLVSGPVTTYRSFKRAYQRYKTTTAEDYDIATRKLANNNLGKIVTVKVAHASSATNVFVKQNPQGVTEDMIRAATDNSTITLDNYMTRYNSPPDLHAITKGLKRILILEEYVPIDMFSDQGDRIDERMVFSYQ